MSPYLIIAICCGIGFLLCITLFGIKTSPSNMQKNLTELTEMAIKTQNEIIKKNEETLKETANISANINKDAVKTIAKSAKEGWTEGEKTQIHCKHCGKQIDADSTFCKYCGKTI